MSQLDTASAVIDALGGTGKLAGRLALDARVVSNWRKRGLPAEMFLVMMDDLKKLGLTASPALWGIKEPAATQEEPSQ
jgi:hypothetical protein